MAGVSDTPLVKKLGYKEGFRVYVEGEPKEYKSWLAPLPEKVTFVPHLIGKMHMIHYFTLDAQSLGEKLPKLRERIVEDGVIWISWLKKKPGVKTNVTEDIVRRMALALGMVDTKVCAVDDSWSAMKLVIGVQERLV